MYAYEYRLDLRNAVGALNIACIDWMTISFGPVVGTLDYGGTAAADQVFVVTGGGIGTIGLASAIQTGSKIKFKFASPVCEGGAPGKGASSFFWGLVSKTPPKFVTAVLHETGGATHIVVRLNGEVSRANYETRAEAEEQRNQELEYRKGQSGNIYSFDLVLDGTPKGEETSKPKLIYRDKEQPNYGSAK